MAMQSRSKTGFATPERLAGTYGEDALEGLGSKSAVWVLQRHNNNDTDQWHAATLTTKAKDICGVTLATGQLMDVPTSHVMPANPPMLEGVEDLTQLSYLNEPSILHDLDYRFKQDQIYTRAGPVLIAVNPFKAVPGTYSPEVAQAYRSARCAEPHVYLVADQAFRAMRSDGMNQSMVISGESGAGKTETTKIAMQYLATLAGGGGMEEKVLRTNPILEAFGNAKTLRNNNSSRFGKLIDIHFDNCGRITGAHIETYLLEKSRVVHQAKGERCYHVFYQLCAGADPTMRKAMGLQQAEAYRYLAHGEAIQIKGMDDAKEFHELCTCLTAVGISAADQQQVFSYVAAILWLGNIDFVSSDTTSIAPGVALQYSAALLGVSEQALSTALTSRSITTGSERIVTPLNQQQAAAGRDALAKAIYSSLFDWLVNRINESISDSRKALSSISILDIYGFESFLTNSFEQLCINYANERLQQLFNQHLFKLEQQEYEKERIDWTEVTFEDNQICLDLIESRPNGILSILDEQSVFPKATDATLAESLILQLESHPRFRREAKNPMVFHVNHYAGPVNYDTNSFLDKNRDVLQADLIQLLASSKQELMRSCAARLSDANSAKTGRAGGSSKMSVCQRFKGQLAALVARLSATAPHFVRCIKPNTSLAANLFEPGLVLQQLRCCGVLEVVRISRMGYPTRYPHQVFVERYAFLLPPERMQRLAGSEHTDVCKVILAYFQIKATMYQMGLSKLFMRAGQIGQMEDLRSRCIRSAIVIQRHTRGLVARRRFRRLKAAVIRTQAIYWGERARREYRVLLTQHHASRMLGKTWRMVRTRRQYLRERDAAITVIMGVRRWLLRARCNRRKKQALEALARDAKKAKFEEKRQIAEARRQAKENMEHKERMAALKQNDVLTGLDKEVAELRLALAQETAARQAAEAAVAAAMAGGGGGGPTAAVADNTMVLETMERLVEQEQAWGEQMESLLPFLQAARAGLSGGGDAFASADFNPLQPMGIAEPTTPLQRPRGPPTPGDSVENNAPGSGRPQGPGERAVSNLVDEFAHRSKVYEDDAEFIVEVKDGRAAADMEPEFELKNLKIRFDSWKKDFKNRMRDTKVLLKQLDKLPLAQRRAHIQSFVAQPPAPHHTNNNDHSDDSDDDETSPHAAGVSPATYASSPASHAASTPASAPPKKKKTALFGGLFKSKPKK